MHEKGVVHTDLTSYNVLLDSGFSAKVRTAMHGCLRYVFMPGLPAMQRCYRCSGCLTNALLGVCCILNGRLRTST